ncbi:DUF6221 family protein [Streptomyces goshikiensis]|uniref:DUF6221 family protein n=1 Tax=Streptomyces goshikiensis TaxID=1942 RepID=UPI00368BE4EA
MDHDVALYMAVHQPVRVLDHLDAKQRLLDLCEDQGAGLDTALLAVLVALAEPFHDHPGHPGQTTPEAP